MTSDACDAPAGHEPSPRPDTQILRPGRNCWRIEPARRATCLVDGEAYFRAAKAAMRRARRSILLLAWDFAADTRLEPGSPDPAEPDRIGDLLDDLVAQHSNLQVRVLVWDKAAWFALRRRRVPGAQKRRLDHGRLHYVLDDRHPPLACHHQKVLVIDDALAFCGGFDFAANRWDTRAHRRDEPNRHKPTGQPYEPHHDAMLAVDGAAARALGDLARDRWWRATGERLDRPAATHDPWPDDLRSDFHDVPVGLVRTEPAWDGRSEIREVERLYLDAIAAARESLYFENQHFASERIADALARRLEEPDGPDIVIVNPKRAPSRLEQAAMDNARTRIAARLRRADRFGRFRLYASLTRGAEIIVHSKLMVVDDRLLRVGSANLNNRSMGADTECDVAIEARSDIPQEAAIRAGIRQARDDLLAEQLGVPAERFAQEVASTGSLIGAIERLNGTTPRTLADFGAPRPELAPTLAHDVVTDPPAPIGMLLRRQLARDRRWAAGVAILAAGAATAALAAVIRARPRRRDAPLPRR